MLSISVPGALEQLFQRALASRPSVAKFVLTPANTAVAVAAESGVCASWLYVFGGKIPEVALFKELMSCLIGSSGDERH